MLAFSPALRALACLAAAAIACSSVRASAQEDTTREARALFQAGEVAFSDGRYETAYNRFREAYELSHRPELLYNIGLAAERARFDREAIAAYEQFLTELPEHSQRQFVVNRLAALRAALERSSAATDTPPPAPSPETEPTRSPDSEPQATLQTDTAEREAVATSQPSASSPSQGNALEPAGWALTIGGGVLAVAGAIVLGIGVADAQRVSGATAPASWADYRDSYGRAEPLQIAGTVVLIAGAASAAIGVVLLALPSSSGETRVHLGPGNLSLEGSF